ncbi:MAG: hypothetical protein ACPGJV_05190 [Bacteriovoracaceae bacterium]
MEKKKIVVRKYTPKQKTLLTVLFSLGAIVFTLSFYFKSKNFYKQYPVYNTLLERHLKTHEGDSEFQIQSLIKGHEENFRRDLMRINESKLLLSEDELDVVLSLIETSPKRRTSSYEQAFLDVNDPFHSFRENWESSSKVKVITRDQKLSEKENLVLQYLEYRNKDGSVAYGMNSFPRAGFSGDRKIVNEVLDHDCNVVLRRVGKFLGPRKIAWLSSTLKGNDLVDIQIAVEQVVGENLSSHGASFNFSKVKSRVEKIQFFSNEFKRIFN